MNENENSNDNGCSNLQANPSIQISSVSLSSLEERERNNADNYSDDKDSRNNSADNKDDNRPVSPEQKSAIVTLNSNNNEQSDRSSITTVSSSDSHAVRTNNRSDNNRMKALSCEMCNNYEIQLQEVQCNENLLRTQMLQHEKAVKNARDELKKEQTFRNELEEKYNEDAKKASQQIEHLHTKIDNERQRLNEIIKKFTRFEQQSNELTGELIQQSDLLKKELDRLKYENELLLGKFIAKSGQMLSEEINIPQNLDELQIYCLTLRENLIQVMVSREQIETKLKSENLFLKEQLQSEQNANKSLEENFQQEIEVLTNQLSIKKREVHELKNRFSESVKQLETVNAQSLNSGEMLSKYDSQITELLNYKTKAEEDIQNLRNKVTSLQVELDNSEEVQRDFVKLSQSLQVQLETIRQADSDVRWQHEDDVTECNNCKKRFHSRKEKTNCRHCGRIFCAECLPKVILSGPNKRPNKVCNVCHTLLDKQTACWFVNEPPKSPS